MMGFVESSAGEFTRMVSTTIYSRQALTGAQAAFRSYCAVRIQPNGPNQVAVTVKPLGEALNSPQEAVLEFWNYVVDTEAQRRLA
jgi:hypothetical protein